MTRDEYRRCDATGLAELIRTGEVSADEVFEAFASRVEFDKSIVECGGAACL